MPQTTRATFGFCVGELAHESTHSDLLRFRLAESLSTSESCSRKYWWVWVQVNLKHEIYFLNESEWVALSFVCRLSYLVIFSITVSLIWIDVYTHVYSLLFQSSVIHTLFQYLLIRGMDCIASSPMLLNTNISRGRCPTCCLDSTLPTLPGNSSMIMCFMLSPLSRKMTLLVWKHSELLFEDTMSNCTK